VVVAEVARKSSTVRWVGVIYGIHDLSHFVPFSQAKRDPLAGRFHVRLTVWHKELAYVDAEESAGDGYVISTTDRLLVVDGVAGTQTFHIGLDFLDSLSKLRPPTSTRHCLDYIHLLPKANFRPKCTNQNNATQRDLATAVPTSEKFTVQSPALSLKIDSDTCRTTVLLVKCIDRISTKH